MDTAEQCAVKQAALHNVSPAQLWIGSPEQLLAAACQFLKQRLCPNKGCNLCITCRNVETYQHHSVRWFAPDGWYKRDDLEDLFNIISLSLDLNQEYFFIIQKADRLTPACFNSLLKSIEEPPAGYFFILLAERLHDVAITIRSRCIIQQFNAAPCEQPTANPLAALFLATSMPTPLALLQALEQTQPDEQLTIELVDILLAHWLGQYQQAILDGNQKQSQQTEKIIALLKDALEEPPMPGSSPLFWKQLFLQVHGS
jgi:DNA polymerase III delta prime subunit